MIDSWMEFCTHELEVGDGGRLGRWESHPRPWGSDRPFVVQGASLHLGAASDAAMICCKFNFNRFVSACF
jgi:hypothetical protein